MDWSILLLFLSQTEAKSMDNTLQRVAEDLVNRLDGPMHLRIIMQPITALILGVRDGLKDAREGRPPYFWAVFTGAQDRGVLLKAGLRAVGKVLLLAMVLDAIYQFIELRRFYPGEALIVAVVLAFIPYLLIRGPVNRLAQLRKSRRPTNTPVDAASRLRP
jgi:hypothetical protein